MAVLRGFQKKVKFTLADISPKNEREKPILNCIYGEYASITYVSK